MPGKGTDLAAHMARAFVEATAATGQSGLIFFIDLSSGFYTVIRELAMRLSSDPDDIDAILDGIEIPECWHDALRDMMGQPNKMDEHIPDHLAEVLADTHTTTWFCAEGREEVAQSLKGSRPGTALADLVFNMAFAPLR